MRVARASPSVSHLLFADDILFFCKAEPRECEEVMKVVRKYEKASGQRINFDKSSLLFGTGSKCKLLAFLKEKLLHRVNGWTGRWLSKGGKEVLIKSILLALPTYVMSSFLLPLKICENLASAIAQFWWSSNPPKKGIHWEKWEKIGRTGIIASEEEDVPVAVEESYSGNYIVVFDPLDGSSNIDAAVSTGSIFGIYSPNDECLSRRNLRSWVRRSAEERCIVNVCQPGNNLLVAGYCMYSTGKIYSFNEGNYQMWDENMKKYIDDLKDPGPSGKPYSTRYIWSEIFIGLCCTSKNGKLRLFYECAQMSFIVEQAGGKGSDGHLRVLDIQPTKIHQRVPLYIGSKEEAGEVLGLSHVPNISHLVSIVSHFLTT
ncbi:hypothetical protein Bca52824_082132 [Brassica carinata]|uniref:D-fructose-1,6-bisphosphate 1-phosphohydrolase n=1 Tax=Brassica carinata TaxID=52824 RepID=A0A8X7PHM4_BRACI|nr:hypothetical protein Bca52824_082132 [Brassica carinata]